MKRSLLLITLLLIACWLRWRYIQEISLYVDEFTTLWAAKQVQAHGLPLMPSGVLYTRGLLSSYIEALFLTLFGFSYTVGRLPSLLFGLGTILATFWIGGRTWRPAVGWLAAMGLALLPEAIIWSGRARFYAQLQFFALLTVWAAWELSRAYGTRHTQYDQPWAKHRFVWLFPLFFILALFSQEEMILLYPSLVVAQGLWAGWRWFWRREILLAHGVCLAAMVVRFVIELVGQPGYFETIQAQRPYVGLVFDLVGAWRMYSPLFVAPERLGWTISGLLAVGVALGVLARSGWRLSHLPRAWGATLFFAGQFWFVVVVIWLFVGVTWRDQRYLFLVQPIWLLLGAAGALWLIEALIRRMSAFPRPRLALGATLALSALTMLTLYPAALRVFDQQVEGYDGALAYLAGVKQPGDVVLSPQPPACALVLGPCDYYAVQQGYEEYVIHRNGQWIDRWSGAQLLNQTAQLETVIRNAPNTWFVTDSFRLATRYEADFVQTVIEQFELAAHERGVMVLRAAGWQPAPRWPISRTLQPPVAFPPLALTGWARTEAHPGADFHLTLAWQALQTVDQQYNTSVRVVARDHQTLAQSDGPPARGLIPTTLFFATPRPDPKTLALPADLPDGRYRIDVAAYDVATLTPLRTPYPIDWFTIGPPPPPPAQPRDARWANGLRLLGADGLPATLAPGETYPLRLVWTTDAPVNEDLTVFVHLTGADGVPVAQSDRAPEAGFYPTWAWTAGEAVADHYTLILPATLPAGEYKLIVGFYDPQTNQRQPLAGGGDAFVLASLRLDAVQSD